MADIASLIASIAPRYGVDPQAALAVAATEGLGGGIGDNGTSFGPFQLHYGGAYPSFAPRGMAASQAWATSPAGVEYALRQIGSVASGLTGRAAIENIVRRFERPANPDAEVAKALGYLGVKVPSAPVSVAAPSSTIPASTSTKGSISDQALLAALFSSQTQPSQMDLPEWAHVPSPTPSLLPLLLAR